MLKTERQQAILDYIKENHAASVADLSKRFFISETSIRRDQACLERSGLIRKTYGGAVIQAGDNDVIALDARTQIEREAKAIIARKAAEFIENGDVIFLDSSSTSGALAPFLCRYTNLSIITHGLRIACELADSPNLKVYSLGGLVMPHAFSTNGALTCRILGDIRANKCFISPKAVDQNVYCGNEEEAAVRRMMMNQSKHVYLMCNLQKLNRQAAFRLCNLSEIETIIFDQQPPQQWMDMLQERGVSWV